MTLAVGVLIASLLGSVHCSAMCGAFVCFYSSGSDVSAQRGSDVGAHAAYNGGRLFSYLVLGSIGGALGRAMDTAGSFAGLQRGAAIVAGALMVGWGGYSALAASGARVRAFNAPEAWRKAMGSILLTVRNKPPVVRAAMTGIATTLLPCGWLYAFVVTAAATGSARSGALVMVFFWLGTLPMMLAVGLGARRFMGAFGARMPILSGAVVMVLGLLSIVGRIGPHATHAMAVMAGMR